MSEQVTNYQCPACTGPLSFVGASGKLECIYCGNAYEVPEIETLYNVKEEKAREEFDSNSSESNWDMSSMSSDWGEDDAGMKSYGCPSCGAEMVCDANTAATRCPYCGNPSVIPGQFGATLKPDYIIPFKLDKETSVAALKKYYKGKKLLPSSFKNGNHIQEINGIYVPFWLFDGVANADATFAATRSHTGRVGDYSVTTTEHFKVYREGSLSFDKIPVDASSKMPDGHMDSIEPYDYGELKPFSSAYLPGYLADKYDVDAQQSIKRAEERCVSTSVNALKRTISGYQTCVPIVQNVQLQRGTIHYALMPVWMLNTKWNDKNYLFAMNGQTGKLVGDLPISWGKFWAWYVGIAVPLAVILALIMYL